MRTTIQLKCPYCGQPITIQNFASLVICENCGNIIAALGGNIRMFLPEEKNNNTPEAMLKELLDYSESASIRDGSVKPENIQVDNYYIPMSFWFTQGIVTYKSGLQQNTKSMGALNSLWKTNVYFAQDVINAICKGYGQGGFSLENRCHKIFERLQQYKLCRDPRFKLLPHGLPRSLSEVEIESARSANYSDGNVLFTRNPDNQIVEHTYDIYYIIVYVPITVLTLTLDTGTYQKITVNTEYIGFSQLYKDAKKAVKTQKMQVNALKPIEDQKERYAVFRKKLNLRGMRIRNSIAILSCIAIAIGINPEKQAIDSCVSVLTIAWCVLLIITQAYRRVTPAKERAGVKYNRIIWSPLYSALAILLIISITAAIQTEGFATICQIILVPLLLLRGYYWYAEKHLEELSSKNEQYVKNMETLSNYVDKTRAMSLLANILICVAIILLGTLV